MYITQYGGRGATSLTVTFDFFDSGRESYLCYRMFGGCIREVITPDACVGTDFVKGCVKSLSTSLL